MKLWKNLFGAALACASLAGANMLSNGNFANDNDKDGFPDYWPNESNVVSSVSCSIVQEEGRRCVKMTRISPDGAMARISQRSIIVKPEHNYRFSIYCKSEGGANVVLYDFLKDNTYLTDHIYHIKSAGWKRFTKEFQTHDTSKEIKISLVADTVGKQIFWADAVLEDLEARPQLLVPLAEKAPELKADWNDPEWKDAVGSDAFTLLGPERKKPTAGTEVRMCITGDQLNVIFYCQEPRMADIELGHNSFSDDTAEIYLRDTSGVLHQYGVTADGACLTAIHKDVLKGFAVNWYDATTTDGRTIATEASPCKTAARKLKNAWIGQFSITLPSGVRAGQHACEVLFARSRKIQGSEENSSWGSTSGQYFKGSNNFVKLHFAVGKEGLSKRPLVAAQPRQMPGNLVLPTPQRLYLSRKCYSYGASVKVYAAPGAERAFQAMAYLLKDKFGLEAVEAAEKDATVSLVLEKEKLWRGFDKLTVWQQNDAYSLETGSKAVARATTHRGLVYAIQTLLQLSCRNDKGELYCRKAEVEDWPDMESRGWHIIAPMSEYEVPITRNLIRTISALKMNWISIQFDSRLQYERHPGLGMPSAPSKETHRQFGELIDLLGMEVIPMTQCISHFNYFLGRPEYRKFAELQTPDPKSSVKYWNYCPRHPEIHKLIFDMIEEHLECYPKAKWYHIGTDEITFEPWGVCERCKGTPCGKLLADEVKVLHDFLAKKGLRTCLWSDQYLVARNGGGTYKTAEATPELPRDIVMFDWHYGELKDYPSVEILQKQGFTVIGNGWFFPANIAPFIDVLFDQKALGFGGTTWTGVRIFEDKPHLKVAMIVGADRSWKRDSRPLSAIAYHPTEAFRAIYQKEDEARPLAFRTLDIGGWCNMSLSGNTSSPWFDLGPENDASMVPTGRQFLGGIPFDIPEGTYGAIQLACDKDKNSERIPEAVNQIPVGGKVRGLSFLHTTSVSEFMNRNLFDRSGKAPTNVGKYIIYYEDGTSDTVVLAFEKQIACWNTRIGTGWAPIVWSGKTKAGACFNLCAYTWKNPKPDLAVTAVDFISTLDSVRPALLAITAIEP